MSDLLFNSKY